MSAREVLQAAVVAAVRQVAGLGVFDAPPVRGGVPFAVVEEPVLGDWSTKSWDGREAKIVLALSDSGERPVRLRRLLGAAEDAVAGIAGELGEGWRLVRISLVRSRIVRGGSDRWTASSEFSVRMMREGGGP